MAKKSMIAKNEKRKEIVARYDERRKQLKAQLIDPNSTDEQHEEARVGLQKLPRDASPVRVRNRDSIDGRPRGTLQKFGISRVRLREMAHRGELPGVIKSSW
ncbi:MAG TPA: 30S ribosomal protein S14 [Candidatus Yaniella excrementigallinarum]|nr:30S ribosomal protein S14 [Candidatus Yaniella excrementigallinarum]